MISSKITAGPLLLIVPFIGEYVLPAQCAIHLGQGFCMRPTIMGHHLLIAYALTLQMLEIMELKPSSMISSKITA